MSSEPRICRAPFRVEQEEFVHFAIQGADISQVD